MRKIACILGLLIAITVSAQVTIIVDTLPENTPKNAAIYISGDFEGWSGGKKKYQLEHKKDVYSIALPKAIGKINFKFTQGSWQSVECTNKGFEVDNRIYTFKELNDTLTVKIYGWTNRFETEKISAVSKIREVLKEREFLSAKINTESIVEIKVNDGTYRILAYSPQIIETTFIPKGETFNPNSHAVVLKPTFVSPEFINEENKVAFKTSGIRVQIDKKPFKISYFYKGKEVTSEKRGYYKSVHNPLNVVKSNIVADETEKIEFTLTSDEVLYGAGARALGMNRRGNRLALFNKADYGYETHSKLMNFTLPIVVS